MRMEEMGKNEQVRLPLARAAKTMKIGSRSTPMPPQGWTPLHAAPS
jgi:hypothetical protein